MKKILFLNLLFIVSVFAQDRDSLYDSLRYRLNISNNVQTTDKWFSQDKFWHFSACASIVGLSYHTLVCRLKRDEEQGRIYSISFTALVGLGKEVYDKKKKGHFSWKDLCWDGAGLVVGYFAFIHRY
uniref:DUF2279 domain-containing protein n=1 Tax=candidate division WOR-3 bacterium TaxID=2052148 RepID=A0A7V0Z7K9_UNCW3